MSILTLKNASKDFGIKAILQDGNLSLEEGEKVGLIGTNGSGKSTLMKMLAGLEPLDQGDRWDRKSTRLNSSHWPISYAVFCLKKKKNNKHSSI